jgi:4-amino-4-deoxy-L-arabinose transferase-like glycosyltransferase
MSRSSTRQSLAHAKWVAPLCLAALALAVRVVPIARSSFDGLYGQDAYAYFAYARALFAALTHAQIPPPFWWALGYPLVLNAGFLLGGVKIAAAQGITLLCGAWVAPAAYALAYKAAPEQKSVAGWVAGLICALSGQLVQSSVVIMSDAPALLFATLGAWLLLAYARTRKTWHLLCASLAVGMAVWTRWQNLIFAAVWLAALVTVEWNAARAPRREARHTPTLFVLRVGTALACIGLVLLPQMLIRVTTNAPLAGQSWLESWSPANFLARTFDNVDGHFEYALPVALFYAQAIAHPAYLFVMLTPLFGVGVVVLMRRRNSSLRVEKILLLGWIAAMLFFLMGIPYENFRFSLGFLSPLAVVTGIGAGMMWARCHSRRMCAALGAWIAVALVVMVYWQPRVLAPVLEIKARELAHARWLETQLLPNAWVFTLSIDGALQEYTHLHVENLWDMDPAKLNPDTPTYLYVDTRNIATQWRGRLPDQLVRGLSDTNNLHPLASFDGWTLYRVR